MARTADIRYQPLTKDLKDVVCFPDMDSSPEDKKAGIVILDRLIAEYGRNTSDSDGSNI